MNGKNSKYVYDRLNLSPDNVNIVVMHGMAAGYKNSEAAEIISIPMFKGKNVDYLALGHIHSYAEGSIDERGTYAYSGCAEGRGFDETGEKGFVLINVENGRLTREFVEFSRRSLFEYTFDVSDFGDWYEARNALLNELSAQFSPESLIKVILSGVHTPDFDIDKEDLTARLNERFFFAKVYDRTGLKVSIEDYETDKSVRGEFVRAVLLSDLSKEEKDAVIMTGLNALKGEGI